MTTVEDELALRNLMARYIDAVNRDDASSWIGTWTENATWNLMGNPVSGRDNILALWQQMMGSFEFAIMMPNNCLYTMDGDKATGHWYLHEYLRDAKGVGTTVLSSYQDTCVKQHGEWLYQSRQYHILYNGPADLSGTYTPLPPS